MIHSPSNINEMSQPKQNHRLDSQGNNLSTTLEIETAGKIYK